MGINPKKWLPLRASLVCFRGIGDRFGIYSPKKFFAMRRSSRFGTKRPNVDGRPP